MVHHAGAGGAAPPAGSLFLEPNRFSDVTMVDDDDDDDVVVDCWCERWRGVVKASAVVAAVAVRRRVASLVMLLMKLLIVVWCVLKLSRKRDRCSTRTLRSPLLGTNCGFATNNFATANDNNYKKEKYVDII